MAILEAVKRVNPLIWIADEKIKNEKGRPIELGIDSPFFFLDSFYQDPAHKIVVRKPSQVGVSMAAVLTEIHAAKYWGINQIHTLPRAEDVNKFVPDKVNQMIRMNPCMKSGLTEKETDAISQKQFGKSFLYFKGTVSSRESYIVSSDRNTYDEVDRSVIKEIANYSSRLEGATSLGLERWISTPTMPGFGIDSFWEISDQKHWRFKCGHCGHEQHMQWPDNIDMEKEVYICSRCGKEITIIDIRSGGWRPRYSEREMSGYWITQMLAEWITPASMIKSFKECEQGLNDLTLEYFYNHKLGMPYVSAESQIPASLVYKNLIEKEHTELGSVIGVDVQLRELYCIVGDEQGVYGIIVLKDDPRYTETEGREGKSKWQRLAEIMIFYDSRYVVIDGGFTPQEVVSFAKQHPGKVYVNWYKEDPAKVKTVRFGDEKGFTEKTKEDDELKVLSDRSRMIDLVLSDMKKGAIRFFGKQSDDRIKELVKHLGVCYARVVEDRVGVRRREWASTGKDDFLHALVYWRIGMMKKIKEEIS